MSARVPGTEAVVSGVRLVAHHVRVDVRDGLARTTIEEAFQNDTGTVLEGRYAFPLPPDASISRLALYVGDELVEGEVVERPRAARIFKSIVDDTVRPRDPALLEWVSASEFSLKIFPIPAKGRRKVVLAYDQPLAEVDSAALRYVYPMSLGDDRATRIDDFSINVMLSDSGSRISGIDTPGYSATIRSEERSATVSYAAHAFTPASDFVVGYSREAGREVMTVLSRPRFERINGVPAQIGYAGGNRLAITSADALARGGGGAAGGMVDIRVTLSPEVKAEVVNQSVQNARVAIVQDMSSDSQLSRVTRQKVS
ncbi:MAG: hypothetical protein HUU06_10845, partial [Planctomycetaceae bacterium]|nr:hypothetical protein [Planctomycetaceae bacterium]